MIKSLLDSHVRGYTHSSGPSEMIVACVLITHFQGKGGADKTPGTGGSRVRSIGQDPPRLAHNRLLSDRREASSPA